MSIGYGCARRKWCSANRHCILQLADSSDTADSVAAKIKNFAPVGDAR